MTPKSIDSDDPAALEVRELEAELAELPEAFQDFSQLYTQTLAPLLEAREQERQKSLQRAIEFSLIAAGILGVGGVLSYFMFKSPEAAIGAGLIAAGFGFFGWYPVIMLGRKLKTELTELIASHLQLEFTAKPGDMASLQTLKCAGLVPAWDRVSCEDKVTGTHKGLVFEFFEAHLEELRTTTDGNNRMQRQYETVFKGQCLRFACRKSFHGRTLVWRDMGAFNGLVHGLGRAFGAAQGLERVALESPEFEKAFQVYSNDQVEARFLLTPDLMQRMSDLDTLYKNTKLQFGFSEGQVLLTLQGPNRFEVGTLFTALNKPARVLRVLKDFTAIFQLIESFEGRAASRA